MPRDIATEILIDAPAQLVWKILTDLPRYPEWNGFLPRVEGRLEEGASIDFIFELPRGFRMRTVARVLEATPPQALRWAGHFLWPRLFRAEHYFLLEPIEAARTRFQHGEIFSGLLLPLAWLVLRTQGPPVYKQMNVDLKRRAEKRVQQDVGG